MSLSPDRYQQLSDALNEAFDLGARQGIRTTVDGVRTVLTVHVGHPREALEALNDYLTLMLAEVDLKETP